MGDLPAAFAARRGRLHEIIFEAETAGGKAFDVALLVAIVLSVLAVCLESVAGVRAVWGGPLRAAEWLFTVLFTIEYVLRLTCVRRPWRYARSFFGLVDLLAVAPTYLSLLVAGTQSLIVIRALRLLRIFRILKPAGLGSDLLQLPLRCPRPVSPASPSTCASSPSDSVSRSG